MFENQELEPYQPPSPTSGFLQIILGVIFLLLVIVGLIAGWGAFLKAAPILVQVLVILVAIAAPAAIIGKGAKSAYLDVQQMRAAQIRVRMDEERLQAMQDARWRENHLAEAEVEKRRAEAERIRAEAEKLRIVVPFDDQGNAALRNPSTWQVTQLQGNMREYPALSSLHFHQSTSGTKITEEKTSSTLPLFPAPRNFTEILSAWRPSTQGIYLIDTLNGAITVPMKDVCHVGLGGPTGGGKCLEENEPVFLADGRVVPAKLLIGKTVEVIGVTDTETMQQTPVLASFSDNGVRTIVEIELDNGIVLKRTLEHPLWTAQLDENQRVGLFKKNGKKSPRIRAINAGWLKANDIRMSGNRPNFGGHVVLCPTSLQQKGDVWQPVANQTFAHCPEGYTWHKVAAVRYSDAPTISIEVDSDNHVFVGYAVEHNTNATRLLTSQMLASGASVYLASPNYAPVKLNGNHLEDWRPITAMLKEPPAREPWEIEQLLRRFIQLLENRRAQEQVSPRRGKDLFLALGEWPAIVATVKEAPLLLGRLLREARQYGIHVIAEFQDALIETIGGNSGVRENYRTAYYFGGDQKTAKILLDLDARTKIEEAGLGERGAAYLRSKAHAACPGRVPWLSNQALYLLLGTPPDPVTDETIHDESQIPEAFQRYVMAGSSPALAGNPEMKGLNMHLGQSHARAASVGERLLERTTGTMQPPVDGLVSASATSADEVPASAAGLKAYGPDDLMMDETQVQLFVALNQKTGNIAESLAMIPNGKGKFLGRRYFTHASNLVKERKLRKA